MIPLVGNVKELENQKAIVVRVADEVSEAAGMKDLKYYVGTMIEIPRAAMTADEIAKEAEFFSFGTNDLTQTTMGLSRDDYTKFSGSRGPENLQGRPVCRARSGRRRQGRGTRSQARPQNASGYGDRNLR